MPPKKRVLFGNRPERKKIRKISFTHDPVGRHIIALRTFYRGLVNHKRLLKLNLKSPGPTRKMPEYPTNYPTHSYLEELRKKKHGIVRQLNFKGHISKKEVEEMRIFAIKKILSQNGYHTKNMKNDDNSLTLLSHVVDTFLLSFMVRLRYHKDSEAFCESQDLWNPLETTLQESGFHGVSGISKYFYHEYVRMGDALYSDCVKELQLIKKFPVENELPSSSMNPDLSSTSMNPDLSSTSMNSDLSSTSIVSSSSSMNPDLPSTSTALPSSSMSPDLPSTSTALPSSPMSLDLRSTSTVLPNSSISPDLPSSSKNLDLPST